MEDLWDLESAQLKKAVISWGPDADGDLQYKVRLGQSAQANLGEALQLRLWKNALPQGHRKPVYLAKKSNYGWKIKYGVYWLLLAISCTNWRCETQQESHTRGGHGQGKSGSSDQSKEQREKVPLYPRGGCGEYGLRAPQGLLYVDTRDKHLIGGTGLTGTGSWVQWIGGEHSLNLKGTKFT